MLDHFIVARDVLDYTTMAKAYVCLIYHGTRFEC